MHSGRNGNGLMSEQEMATLARNIIEGDRRSQGKRGRNNPLFPEQLGKFLKHVETRTNLPHTSLVGVFEEA